VEGEVLGECAEERIPTQITGRRRFGVEERLPGAEPSVAVLGDELEHQPPGSGLIGKGPG